MTQQEITSLSERVFTAWLGRFGFDHAHVVARSDHDGEAALFIDAHFRGSAEFVDPDAFLSAIENIQAELRESGDARFPYVRLSTSKDAEEAAE